MKNDNSARASIAVIVGAPGSGKSSSVNVAVRASEPDRLLVFDPGEDYTEYGTVFRDCKSLYQHLIKAGQGPFSAVLCPSDDQERERGQFNEFCLMAFAVGRLLVVADELEDVMTATWSPAGWRRLVRKGRKRNVKIIGASQRPAGIEKRLWAFANVVRSGFLEYDEDAAVLASRLRVSPDELKALPALSWVQWSREKQAVTRGRIEYRSGRPHEVVTSEKIFSPPGASS